MMLEFNSQELKNINDKIKKYFPSDKIIAMSMWKFKN